LSVLGEPILGIASRWIRHWEKLGFSNREKPRVFFTNGQKTGGRYEKNRESGITGRFYYRTPRCVVDKNGTSDHLKVDRDGFGKRGSSISTSENGSAKR
jgi:hypothetical protein